MKTRTLQFCAIALALLVAFSAAPAGATTWSAAGDFDVVSPNGDWSYGYHKLILPDGTPPEPIDGFTLMTAHNAVLSGVGLVNWTPAESIIDPNIVYNNTGSTISSWGIEWDAGELALGPNPAGVSTSQGTGVRWTAPAAGDYAIDMTFTLNQGELSQPIKVYHNGTLLLDDSTGDGLGASVNYAHASFGVHAGDTIDLIATGAPTANTSLFELPHTL